MILLNVGVNTVQEQEPLVADEVADRRVRCNVEVILAIEKAGDWVGGLPE